MHLTRVHTNFYKNWPSIVLAVISIIQGLAFNDLAARLQITLTYTFSSRDFVPAAHFLLAFLLLLRVFQTYITAALDYEEWATNFYDVLLIFVIGLLEYYLFSSLAVPGFKAAEFHKRLSIVSGLALAGYLSALLRLRQPAFPSYSAFRKERRLQLANVAGVVVMLGISASVLLLPGLPQVVLTAVGILGAAVLGTNSAYSIAVTFSALPADTPTQMTSARSEESPIVTNAAVEVRRATKQDVAPLARLMVESFAYIYATIFDSSPRLTERILRGLLSAGGGRCPHLGYRAFHVAYNRVNERVAGGLNFRERNTVGRAWYLLVPIVILRHLGIIGLFRSWRNFRAMRDIVPFIQPDQMYVQYVCVDRDYQHAGVGAQLMRYAEQCARDCGKTSVSLEVRDHNSRAREFFRRMGFDEAAVITRDSDELFGRGASIHMEKLLANQANARGAGA